MARPSWLWAVWGDNCGEERSKIWYFYNANVDIEYSPAVPFEAEEAQILRESELTFVSRLYMCMHTLKQLPSSRLSQLNLGLCLGRIINNSGHIIIDGGRNL